jgi:hypothetical protein
MAVLQKTLDLPLFPTNPPLYSLSLFFQFRPYPLSHTTKTTLPFTNRPLGY